MKYETFLNSLQISSSASIINWPVLLARSLPILLTKLLASEYGQTLERMQLVSIGIKILGRYEKIDEASYFSDIKIVSSDLCDQFIYVKSYFMSMNKKILGLSIKYFIRGQRKFFKPQIQLYLLDKQDHLLPISETDIIAFFNFLGQNNSFWFSHKLAELNGRSNVTIPSQMLLTLGLLQGLSLMGEKKSSYRYFELNFHQVLKKNQPLVMSYGENQQEFRLNIASDQGLVISLNAAL
jgi:hypothetical protein